MAAAVLAAAPLMTAVWLSLLRCRQLSVAAANVTCCRQEQEGVVWERQLCTPHTPPPPLAAHNQQQQQEAPLALFQVLRQTPLNLP